ncbi:MAG: TraB/GumN family protein [Erythrobacter sp.]|uniref:TraB/GumN family protein n=1 Tax=Erythrobacter sp. TaxID=1042 RepID=UPI002B4916FB|nr:TraB/GumN family protein [Erythrobacter sp.]WRH70986.1 MAG: TraB/GumN family protein [Erythrobacter sp.]
MKLTSLLALTAAPLALFAASPALADNHATTAAATPAAKPAGPALWKVADEDTTIYLFGTVHVLPQGIDWYDTTIAKALDSSDMIVTEIKMDKASEAEMQQLTMKLGMLPGGTTLRSLLTPEQTAAYEAGLAKLGAPPAAFDPLKPWLAGLTLSLLPLMQQGYTPDSGVEKVLLGKAGTKGQGALETAEFQLGIFNGMSTEAQVAFMMEAVEGMDEVKPTLDRMVAEWAEGDAEGLAAVMNEGMSDPAVAEALLYSRNANWAEWIDTRLDKPGTIFIAVGAGHLAGAKSVQDYLAGKGIAVTRVK